MHENAGKTPLPSLWGQGAGGWGACRDIKNSPLPTPDQLCPAGIPRYNPCTARDSLAGARQLRSP